MSKTETTTAHMFCIQIVTFANCSNSRLALLKSAIEERRAASNRCGVCKTMFLAHRRLSHLSVDSLTRNGLRTNRFDEAYILNIKQIHYNSIAR